MARPWAWLRVVFGRGELKPNRQKGESMLATIGRKVREGWKAVVALATPIALTAAGDLIDAVGDWIQLEYPTSIWVGVITAGLVWLKSNLPA